MASQRRLKEAVIVACQAGGLEGCKPSKIFFSLVTATFVAVTSEYREFGRG
jgi:hypothetical protein